MGPSAWRVPFLLECGFRFTGNAPTVKLHGVCWTIRGSMNLSRPTLLQCNWVLGLAVTLLLLSALLSRLHDERICTWIALLASVAAVYLIWRGFGSRLNALLRVGFAYLAASWGAYCLWHFHMMPQYHPTVGIDPFAGPLSIMASFIFILGLTTWISGIWVNRREPFMKRFIQQRVYWTLGTSMILTSSYFFGLIAGV